MSFPERVYLSPPDVGPRDFELMKAAFDSNWIAPVGPFIDRFERDIRDYVGIDQAVAVSSGTAALYLGLKALGIGPGDEVVIPSMTFVASASPVVHLGATPIFVDSCRESWNMSATALEALLAERAVKKKLPKAVIVVHLYGQCADLDAIASICDAYGIILVEDAAESLGASYKGRQSGTFGAFGVYSFNGNKIITTSGGGMLVTPHRFLAERVRYLATQAREPVGHYEHKELGHNFRLSNLLAALGVSQLESLEHKIRRRREHFNSYKSHLAGIDGLKLMPIADYGEPNYWLTCITIDEKLLGLAPDDLVRAFDAHNIESRPLWKPLHEQPVFRANEFVGEGLCSDLFRTGLCLPSGSILSPATISRVAQILLQTLRSHCASFAGEGSDFTLSSKGAREEARHVMELGDVP